LSFFCCGVLPLFIHIFEYAAAAGIPHGMFTERKALKQKSEKGRLLAGTEEGESLL
jgi:hypothetical protein